MANSIYVYEAREKVVAGTALLACVYPEDAKFRRANIEGAMALSQFAQQLPSLSKEQELIFYFG